ncbi:MAG: CDP-glycerol glycerophosphotransferase family protein [Opitutus sp.]|nr:CDP-glycerol glycerophosphotransferase family protein [Opitutus sp.]
MLVTYCLLHLVKPPPSSERNPNFIPTSDCPPPRPAGAPSWLQHVVRVFWTRLTSAKTETSDRPAALSVSPTEARSPATEHYEAGVALMKTGKVWQAASEFRAAVEADPSNAQWFFRLGDAEEQMGRHAEGAEAFKAAIQLDPSSAMWHYRLGYAWEQAGELEKANTAYAEAIARDTTGLAQRFGIGVFHQKRGLWELSAAAYSARITDEAEAELFYRLGMAHDRCYHWKEAAKNYQEAITRDYTRGAWHARLAFVLERMERWEEAAEAYTLAVARTNAFRAELYYRLGFTLTKAGKHAEATEALLNTRILRRPFGVPLKDWKKDRRRLVTTSYLEYSETLPIRDNVILYESYLGRSINCNPYSIFLHLLQDSKYRNYLHVWSVIKGTPIPSELLRMPNVVFVARESDLYLRYLATAKWLINNTTFPYYFIRRPEQRYLNTWHGTPLKAMGKDMSSSTEFMVHANSARNFLHATHLLSPNEHTTRVLIDRYDLVGAFTGRVAQTGYPRIDTTLRMTAERKRLLRRKLELDENTPVVLYAPTWRGTASRPLTNVERIQADCSRLATAPCQFIFRGHHFEEQALKNSLDGVKVAPPEIDTYELLAIVDVLITDYSSIFFDFLATRRPIIHYVYDLEEYQQKRGKFYLSPAELPGVVAHDIDDLMARLPSVLADSSASQTARYLNAVRTFCPTEDGDATNRAVQFSLKIGRNGMFSYRGHKGDRSCSTVAHLCQTGLRHPCSIFLRA